MRIGDEVYIHGYVDEIRKDTIIIKNEGGYFGTIPSEIKALEKEPKTDRLYSWLNDMRLGIAPDETVTDIDERNVRIAQTDLLDEIMEWLEKNGQEQKTGHWVYSKMVNTGEIVWSECSVCRKGERGCAKRMKYCPNCGAKMESEGEE